MRPLVAHEDDLLHVLAGCLLGREIENVVSDIAVAATGHFIDIGDLPEHLQKPESQSTSPRGDWRPLLLDEVRHEHIQRVLDMCNGNRVRASRILGIGRTSLYRFLNPPAKHPVLVPAKAAV